MADVSMQRILLNTNTLLDYLLHCDDHAKIMEAVMELGVKNNTTLLRVSLLLGDITYLSLSAIRRELKSSKPEVESFTRSPLSSWMPWHYIGQVKETRGIVAVGEPTRDRVFSLQRRHQDFEDNLVIVAAQQSDTDCMVISDTELISLFPECRKTPARIVATSG